MNKKHALEDDIQRVAIARHALVLHDARMPQALHDIYLAHELLHVVLRQTLEPDALHRNSLTGEQIQRTVHRPKLPTPNAVAQLLN